MKNMGILTQKEIDLLNSKEKNLSNLDDEVDIMNNCFYDMRTDREEARKQLQAKFQDVHRKINNAKEYQIIEAERITNTLTAIQSKFSTKLQQNKKDFEDRQNKAKSEFYENQDKIEDYQKIIKDKIKQEKADRIKETEDTFQPIYQKLKELHTIQRETHDERINTQAEVEDAIATHSKNYAYDVEQEGHFRSIQHKKTKQAFDDQMKVLYKTNAAFSKKTIDEAKFDIDNMNTESQSRFDEQDIICDNMSNIVKTIQDTLRVMADREEAP